MSIKVKYGTKAKWGAGWKYGYGTSEPWVPTGNDPTAVARFNVESLTDGTPTATLDTNSTPTFTADSASTPTYAPDP